MTDQRGRRPGPGFRPPWWPQDEPWPPQGRGGPWRGGPGPWAAGAGPGWSGMRRFFLRRLLLLWLGLSGTVRRVAVRSGDVMEAADRFAAGDHTARVDPRGPREVRSLGKAFNAMAERLEANEEQRRNLLADVTHELRTPLSVIRG